jgi:hypothetical protein
MPNLTGMNVEALMNLRNQVDKRLLEHRAELEKQLAAIAGQSKRKASWSLRRSHQNIAALQARLGPEGEQSLGGWLRP